MTEHDEAGRLSANSVPNPVNTRWSGIKKVWRSHTRLCAVDDDDDDDDGVKLDMDLLMENSLRCLASSSGRCR